MLTSTDLGDGITCIDTGYTRPGMTACYLVHHNGKAAFIETGVNNNVPGLLTLLDQKGIARDAVDYVIPTHVHLDHAGGAGLLIQNLPAAKLVIHPYGARHIINPEKLVAGTKTVYGEEKFHHLYGELVPVPEEHVIEAPDEFEIQLGGRTLRFLDTPGHASHHFCVYDEYSQSVFTGDTFGLSYREFDTTESIFCLPTTTPVQFKPDKLHQSIDRIVALQPRQALLTHYGPVSDIHMAARQLHADIDAYVEIVTSRLSDAHADDAHNVFYNALKAYYLQRLHDEVPSLSAQSAMELLDADLHLNAQGLVVWASRQ